MNEIEMKKQSFDIQRVSNEIEISDSESLGVVFEILKAVKKHKENITSYWKSAKESAKKTYQDIHNQMLRYTVKAHFSSNQILPVPQ